MTKKTEKVSNVKASKEAKVVETKVIPPGRPTPLTLEALEAYIEQLKKKNPVKYAAKKAELDARLASFE